MTVIIYRDDATLSVEDLQGLYRANNWSSGEKPERLAEAMRNSHSVISATAGDRLVGLVNALSDGALVVYYPHLLVHPDFQGQGIGHALMTRIMARYEAMHQQVLVAENPAAGFYRKLGFEPADGTQALWIYDRSGGV